MKLFFLLVTFVSTSICWTVLASTDSPTTSPSNIPTASPTAAPNTVIATMQSYGDSSELALGEIYVKAMENEVLITGNMTGLNCSRCRIGITYDYTCDKKENEEMVLYYLGPTNPWLEASFIANETINMGVSLDFPEAVFGRTVVVYEENEENNITKLACGKLLFPSSEVFFQFDMTNVGSPVGRVLDESEQARAQVVGDFQLRENKAGFLTFHFKLEFHNESMDPTSSPISHPTVSLGQTDSPTATPTVRPTEAPITFPTPSPLGVVGTVGLYRGSGCYRYETGPCDLLEEVFWRRSGLFAQGEVNTTLTAEQANEIMVTNFLLAIVLPSGGKRPSFFCIM